MQQQTKYQHYELVKDDRMEKILTDKIGMAAVKTTIVGAEIGKWSMFNKGRDRNR